MIFCCYAEKRSRRYAAGLPCKPYLYEETDIMPTFNEQGMKLKSVQILLIKTF